MKKECKRPRWPHACKDCVFLGRYNEYDLYYCTVHEYPIARDWDSEWYDGDWKPEAIKRYEDKRLYWRILVGLPACRTGSYLCVPALYTITLWLNKKDHITNGHVAPSIKTTTNSKPSGRR